MIVRKMNCELKWLTTEVEETFLDSRKNVISVFPKFSLNSLNSGFYYSASKTHAKDGIFKLTLIHVSVTYPSH